MPCDFLIEKFHSLVAFPCALIVFSLEKILFIAEVRSRDDRTLRVWISLPQSIDLSLSLSVY